MDNHRQLCDGEQNFYNSKSWKCDKCGMVGTAVYNRVIKLEKVDVTTMQDSSNVKKHRYKWK